MAEIVQADLAKVGIEVALVGEEESSIDARQNDGRFGMIFNRTWGAPYDPHAFVSSMRVPSHADYQAQLGLPDKAEIDAMIGKVLVSTDEKLRQDMYRQIMTRLHEEAVYLPLTYVTAIAVARPELGPIPFGAMSSEIPFEKIHPKGM
jgi:nickel transport system substrate-binding protein